ncbi:MAG: hypothetical protein ACOYMR_08400 [Ilumatobacteraceae bacterium]
MTPNRKFRRGLVWAMAAAATFGVGVGAAGLASAASGSTSTTITTVADTTTDQTTVTVADGTGSDGTTLAPPADDGTRPDPASLPNGPGETVLTGDTAAKVTAAAEAAQPGATVVRVETDSSGHAYEAHVQLADGTYMTLYFDESFVADGNDDGFGPAPAGMHDGQRGGRHDGQPPRDQPPAGQTPTTPTDSSTTTG